MTVTREQIYNALAAELKTVAGLNTVSRVYLGPNEYSSAAQLPAGCLDENSESIDNPLYGAPGTYTLSVDFWIYMLAPQNTQIAGQETVIPMTALNTVLDAIDVAFPSDPTGDANTLGGLVQHAYVQGKILKVAGVGNGNLLLTVGRVPIQILAV